MEDIPVFKIAKGALAEVSDTNIIMLIKMLLIRPITLETNKKVNTAIEKCPAKAIYWN